MLPANSSSICSCHCLIYFVIDWLDSINPVGNIYIFGNFVAQEITFSAIDLICGVARTVFTSHRKYKIDTVNLVIFCSKYGASKQKT